MERLGAFFARGARQWLPEPLVIAVALTLLTLLLAVLFPATTGLQSAPVGRRALSVTELWLGGVWNPAFLTFALQMCVVLLTGYGLARAPLATRGLRAVARVARSNSGAVVLVAVVSCVGCWINWGFGLILGGLLANEVRGVLAERGVRCQYPLLVAAAYAGMMVWHGGLSGSAPLKVAGDGVTITRTTEVGTVEEKVPPISIRDTTLAPVNLALTVVLIVGVPLMIRSMASADGEGGARSSPGGNRSNDGSAARSARTGAAVGSAAEESDGAGEENERSPAAVLNRSRILGLAIAGVATVSLGVRIGGKGWGAVDLNFVNTVFLTLGLMLHRSLVSYMSAVADGGRAIAGIVVQFPLYSGIQGVMFGAGLAGAISDWFVGVSEWAAMVMAVGPEHTLPVATFFSAGIVNLFVPSGGGQWIVQGPIMCSAAAAMDVPINQTVMAVAYGDQWTNMVQPFWAIPLMGLTGVNVRRFMGYGALLMILACPVFVLALLLF